MDINRHDIVDWPQKERDGYVFTEINTVVNAFHIEAMKEMAEMARAVGKDKDADAFVARVKLAKSSFQETLFDEAAGIYRDGVGTDHSSIHANFFPLAFGLIPEDKIDGVIDWLETKDMQCSVYAAHMVNSVTTIGWEAWDLKLFQWPALLLGSTIKSQQ